MKKMKRKLVIVTTSFFLLMGSSIVLASGDASAGKTKYAQCSYCHGQDAKGMATNPALAGIDKVVFSNHISAFKSGKRKNPMMEMMAKKLSDQDIDDLAAYFGSL